jgi:hypothetical protein
MTPAKKESMDWPPAPLHKARRLLGTVLIASSLIAIALATHLAWHNSGHHAAAANWMRTLTLSAPALWPAGSPMRHPETVHPAVDLRFVPGMETVP